MKNLKISAEFLKKIGACKPAIKRFSENVGTGEYLVSDLVENKSLTFCYCDVFWLLRECPEFRTAEMLEYFKSLNPNYEIVRWLLRDCPEFRTPEMLEYYKSLYPGRGNIKQLIYKCPELEKLLK